MPFNPNELIIDRVRYLTFHDINTQEQLFMLSQLEDPSLNTTSEGEDVTDAVGAIITTLYRSKQAEFTATNSLLSLGLAAAQFGADKEVATETNKIVNYTYQFIDIPDAATEVTLKHIPVAGSVKYIYKVTNGVASTSYKAGATASATEFTVNDADGKITLPTGLTGQIFVEYQYESANAVRIVNSSSEFPEVGSMIVYVIFKDVCTEELLSGKVVFPKCKLDPSSVELALTATGKHPFTIKAYKDYCAQNEQLFTFLVDGDED